MVQLLPIFLLKCQAVARLDVFVNLFVFISVHSGGARVASAQKKVLPFVFCGPLGASVQNQVPRP